LWTSSVLLILLQIFKVWEVFLVRSLVSDMLYPVAAIEPVLTLTSLVLSLIYLHTCLRENKYIALGLLTGYHFYTFTSHIFRLASFTQHGLGYQHIKVVLTLGSVVFQGTIILSLLFLHGLDLTESSEMGGNQNLPKTSPAYRFNQANILSKLTFYWLLPLLRLGYQVPLEQTDLTPLPFEEQVKQIFLNLKEKLKTRNSLIRKCVGLNKGLLVMGAFLRLFADLLGFSGALGIQIIVTSLQDDISGANLMQNATMQNATYDKYDSMDTLTIHHFISCRMVAAVVILIAAFCQGAFSQLSSHVLTVAGIRTRNALQVCIYEKALQLSIGTQSFMKGDDKENLDKNEESQLPDETVINNIDLGGILNLATEDTLNIREFIWNIHYIWSLPLKICIIIVLVYSRLGISAACGSLLGTIITIPCQFLVGKAMSRNNRNIMESEDKRLQASTEALQNMKTLKLNCWEDLFLKRINGHRNKELKLLAKDSFFWSVMAFFASISTLLVTTITIGIYTGVESQAFSAAELFTALALFNQLAVCLSIFPVTVPIFIKGFVSRKRLLTFLDKQEAVGTSVSLDSSHQRDEDEKLEKEDEDDDVANPPKNKHLLRFIDASFAWQPGSHNILHNLNLIIPSGGLTIIIGSSGCGKTSLISAILKEMRQTSGQRELDTIEQYSKYAFLPQNPWLLNASVKDNILFGRPYKEKRYMKTIRACDIQSDIEMLPDGNETEVGERGVLLSGGQRQRLGLARCLYSTAPIVLLDAPFSAIDNKLSHSIMDNAIINILLKKKRTVIMTTDDSNILSYAQYVIVLEHGRIRMQGSFEDVVAEYPEAQSQSKVIKEEKSGTKTACERWRLLKNVTRCGMIVKNTIETKKKQFKLPMKQSVQDMYLPRVGTSKRNFFRTSRMDSASQLNIHHDIILPSDEGMEESLGDMEGLLSNRHKQLLLKCLAKRESSKLQNGISNNAENPATISNNFSQSSTLNGNAHILKRLQSERFLESKNNKFHQMNSCSPMEIQPLAEHTKRRPSEHQGFNNNIKGAHLSLTPKESILSLVHNRVLRLTSTASAVSGVSGFSDDFQDDENDDGLITSGESNKENREYGSISYNVYWQYLRAGGLWLLIVFLVLSVGLQTMKVYLDYLLRDLVGEETPEDIRDFFKLFGCLSFTVIILTYFYNILGQWIGASARTTLHNKMLQNLFQCPIELFEAYPIGRILNRMSCDMYVIDQKLPSCLQRLLLVSLICLSSLTVNCIQSPLFIVCALPIIGVYWWIQHFYRCSSRELQRLDSLSRAPVFSHFSDTLTGLVTIRSFRVQPKFVNELCEKIDANTAASLILQSGCRWLGLTLDVIGSIIVFASVTIAVIMTEYTTDPAAPASMGLLISYSLLVPIYLAWVVKFVADIENYMNAVERVLEYTGLENEEDPKKYPETIDTYYEKGNISFENVYLGYYLDNRVVISGLHLQIPAKEKIAICGRSGSGKSTLIMGLMRMAKKIQGRITIDGIEITERPLSQLRKFICVIHQDVALISGTLRSNLDPMSQFTDHQLWSILEKLDLKEATLQGLETEVIDSGVNFTPTDRQLISIARCVLNKPRVVVLDEATSAMDSKREKNIQQILLELLHQSTLITVAHRLTNILEYDRVLVIGEGKILEDGAPKELLKKPMGFFSALFRQESKSLS